MTLRYFCDRCYKNTGTDRRRTLTWHFRNNETYERNESEETIDLCQKCHWDISAFIKCQGRFAKEGES